MSNIVIPDGGTIGSTSDTDAIAISSGGNVTLSQTLDGGAIGSAVTMSANQACVKTALNASGSAPIYACRAWVNFNGTGTVAIRASANVSSITDNGTGDYTVNFETAMHDTNYVVTGLAKEHDNTNNTSINLYYAKQTIANTIFSGSIRINTLAGANGGAIDSVVVSVAIFR